MRILHRIKYLFSPHKQFLLQLEDILGYMPRHMPYYKQALMHRSSPKDLRDNNERLEFLGDAILGAIIAEYLFKKYPNQPEGYLTELRSKIVRRETMNNLAMRMGINKLMQYNQSDQGLARSHIFGNALEALIGAVFLDQGFENTRKFVITRIIRLYINLDTIDTTHANHKNFFLTWAQKHNYTVTFETIEEKIEGPRKLFHVGIMLNGVLFESGKGYTKKDAGQVASQKALEKIKTGGDLSKFKTLKQSTSRKALPDKDIQEPPVQEDDANEQNKAGHTENPKHEYPQQHISEQEIPKQETPLQEFTEKEILSQDIAYQEIPEPAISPDEIVEDKIPNLETSVQEIAEQEIPAQETQNQEIAEQEIPEHENPNQELNSTNEAPLEQ